jgi:hypothetical protein
MDIALGLLAFTAAWSRSPVNYRAFCITADALVPATRVYIGQDYNAGQRKEVVQAADFLIKEAESCSSGNGVGS